MRRCSHIALFSLYAVILVGFSQFLFVSESEFWPWNVGYNLGTLMTKTWVWDRPIFFGLIGLATSFGDNVWQTLLHARALSAFWCCGLMATTGLLVLHFTGKKYLALLAMMLLMANTTFVSQAYRIRSDTLAMFFLFIGLLLILRGLGRYGWMFVISTVLITPKAAFFAGPAILWLLWKQKSLRWGVGFGLAVCTLVWLKSDALTRQFEFLRHAFMQFPNSGNYIFVKLQFQENWWFWLLSAVMLFTCSERKKLVAAYAACFALLLLYPEPYQFYIAALLPAFVILFCVSAQSFLSQHEQVRKALTFIIFLLSVGVPVNWYFYNMPQPGMKDQLTAFMAVDRYMEEHRFSTLYDGVGAFPHRMFPQAYTGPGESAALDILQSMASDDFTFPDFITYTGRMFRLGPQFVKYLNRYYVEVLPDFYMRAFHNTRGDFGCDWMPWHRTLEREMLRHRYLMGSTNVILKYIRLQPGETDFEWTEQEPTTQEIMTFNEAALVGRFDKCHWNRIVPVTNILGLGPFTWANLYRIDN